MAAAIAIVYAHKTLKLEQDKREHELARESKHQASQLSAWVAVVNPDGDPEDKRYGVVLQNNSGAIVHDVRVSVKLFDKEVHAPASAFVLPPGQFFIRRHGPEEKHEWGFIQGIEELDGHVVRPYVNTSKHRVQKITYGDSLRQLWQQDECGRLTEMGDASAVTSG